MYTPFRTSTTDHPFELGGSKTIISPIIVIELFTPVKRVLNPDSGYKNDIGNASFFYIFSNLAHHLWSSLWLINPWQLWTGFFLPCEQCWWEDSNCSMAIALLNHCLFTMHKQPERWGRIICGTTWWDSALAWSSFEAEGLRTGEPLQLVGILARKCPQEQFDRSPGPQHRNSDSSPHHWRSFPWRWPIWARASDHTPSWGLAPSC